MVRVGKQGERLDESCSGVNLQEEMIPVWVGAVLSAVVVVAEMVVVV